MQEYRADRVMYGSDFPNIPYAWDRELKKLQKAGLTADELERITYKNAIDFFAIDSDVILGEGTEGK